MIQKKVLQLILRLKIVKNRQKEKDKSKYYEQVIYENDNLTEDVIFTSLLTTYPRIMIQADFRTQFYGTMMAGNYGLKN